MFPMTMLTGRDGLKVDSCMTGLVVFAVGFTISIVPNQIEFVESARPSGHCKSCKFLSADFGGGASSTPLSKIHRDGFPKSGLFLHPLAHRS